MLRTLFYDCLMRASFDNVAVDILLVGYLLVCFSARQRKKEETLPQPQLLARLSPLPDLMFAFPRSPLPAPIVRIL